MKCIFDNEVEESQLLAYLDHEANQDTVKHLEQCAYCLERANALARLHDHLTDNFYRVDCPTSLELGEYHLHMLTPAQMLVISQHVRDCPHCTREIEQLEEFLSDLTPDAEINPLQKVKVLIARMVGERDGSSATSEPSFALRGESEGPITFVVEDIVIVLDIQPVNNEKVNILGQVAADDQDLWTEAIVELHQNNELQLSTIVDDLGAFQLEGVMPGLKELQVTSKNGSIVIISNFKVSI